MIEKIKQFKLLIGAVILVLFVAIPITVIQVQKQQETRSRASGEAISIGLKPSTGTVQIGQALKVEVRLNGGSNNISAVDITFSYDKDLLDVPIRECAPPPPEITNYQCGAGPLDPSSTFATVINDSGTLGVIRYVGVNPTGNTITGTEISLGFLNFIGKAQGNAEIGFSNIHVNASGVAGALPVDTENTKNGTYTIGQGQFSIRDFLNNLKGSQTLKFSCNSNCNGLAGSSIPFTITQVTFSFIKGYYDNDPSKTWRLSINGLDAASASYTLYIPGGEVAAAVLDGSAKFENGKLYGDAKTRTGQYLSWEINSNSACTPRPGCLDSEPRCLPPEPIGGWCPGTSPTPTRVPIYNRNADLNDDGKINELDLNILYSAFSKRKGD